MPKINADLDSHQIFEINGKKRFVHYLKKLI